MVLMFWLAFALGATTSVSGRQRIFLSNDASGGAWVQQDTPTTPDLSSSTDPARQKADEMTRRQGGSVQSTRPERLPDPRGGI